ncbi:MAG: fructose-bisphosphate aldolase class I, partial [Salinisphaera sp.]|nr:fructose-bisphosphate aldolase class I [Salinisphaera sp.]
AIGKGGLPSRLCQQANAHALARYAALCQEAGIVPMIEPEVLIQGDHDIERCQAVTTSTLQTVFSALYTHRVLLEGVILKTSMVISGLDAPRRAGVEEVADRTVTTLKRCLPAALGGVVFLSGGQGNQESTAHLNAMNQRWGNQVPWPMTFSYARALQQPALEIWRGQAERAQQAQAAFAFRAQMNGLAASGKYSESLEAQAA